MNFKNLQEKEKLNEQILKYEFALQMLETEINILIKEFEYKNKYNPIEYMKSRIKSEESAIEKLKSRGYKVNVDNLIEHVHDMIGIRIVCSFYNDVYKLAEIIKNSKQLIIKEEQDYLKKPKDTGYISYHILVEVPIYLNKKVEYIEAEIQIRTIAMDCWASLDHKILYKFNKPLPSKIKKEMYNCSLDIKALDEKMQKLNDIVKKYKS